MRRRIGDLSRIALSLSNVAQMALQEGETDKAATMFAEAAEIATAIGDKRQILFALAGLGWVAHREERREEAGTHARESLRLAQELGMKRIRGGRDLLPRRDRRGHGRHGAGCSARSRSRIPPLASCTPRGRQSRLPGDHRERESDLRPGNLGASLGGGPSNESRRGRRLRTLLRLTASAEAEGGARVHERTVGRGAAGDKDNSVVGRKTVVATLGASPALVCGG